MVSKRSKARDVLKRAISGELTLEDFHSGWPEGGDALVDVIFEEAEDTIEHTPGSLLKRRRDDAFQKSVPHKMLVVDRELLSDKFENIPSERLVEIRARLLQRLDLEQDDDALAMSAREFVAREIHEPRHM